MSEGLSEIRIKAEELAGNLFENLVDEALGGKDVQVAIDWVDDVDFAGEPTKSPSVVIGGVPAQAYCRRIMEWTTTDEELISSTSKSFEEAVGMTWESTIDYFKDLDQLDRELNILSLRTSAGFYWQAKDELAKQWLTPTDEQVVPMARELAQKALQDWVEVVDSEAESDSDAEGSLDTRETREGKTIYVTDARGNRREVKFVD